MGESIVECAEVNMTTMSIYMPDFVWTHSDGQKKSRHIHSGGVHK